MKQSSLRSGFTTGTCAAAAAKAAAVFLLEQKVLDIVCIEIPKKTIAEFTVELSQEPDCIGYFRVQKDAGDDPDVTHGSWIYAAVSQVDQMMWDELCCSGAGYLDERYPGLYLTGGKGIGMVTRPGLQCPVGKYAINPVPREMIFRAVSGVRDAYQPKMFLMIQIAVPDGEQLAGQTFNPRLGIEGGISILGTSGIVEPMSEQALLDTIQLDIRMKVLGKSEPVIITPGNYGEAFLRETLGIPLGEAVKCSNFIADTTDMLRIEGAHEVLFVGHIGKLIKVAGGVKNTHSCYGDRRMEILAEIVSGYAPDLVPAVLAANTTEEAIGFLVTAKIAVQVLDEIARRIQAWMRQWSEDRLLIEVVTFSSAYGILGKTNGVGRMVAGKQGRRQE